MAQIWKASYLRLLMIPRESSSPPLHQWWCADAGWLAFSVTGTALEALNSRVIGRAMFWEPCCRVLRGGVLSPDNEISLLRQPA